MAPARAPERFGDWLCELSQCIIDWLRHLAASSDLEVTVLEFGLRSHKLTLFSRIALWRWRCQGLAVVFAVSCAIQALLGLSFRGLYADGAYFVTQIAAQQDFYIAAPARRTSGLILELPLVAAIKLGIESPYHLALIFSIFVNLLPGAVFILCRTALPAAERQYLIFPAFVYFAGVLSAQFAGVTEGLFSTAYLWLLLYLILFGCLSPGRLGLILVLSIGSIRLHEETSFLALLLLSAAWLRRGDATSRTGRTLLYLILVTILVSAFVGAYWCLYPANPSQRESIIRDLADFAWLYVPGEGCNLPAALGLVAGLAIVVCVGCPRLSRITAIAFSVAAICLAISSFWVEALTLSYSQFAARHNAGLLSFPLMIVPLAARFAPGILSRFNLPPVHAIVMVLGVSAQRLAYPGDREMVRFPLAFPERVDLAQRNRSFLDSAGSAG